MKKTLTHKRKHIDSSKKHKKQELNKKFEASEKNNR